MKLPKKLHTNLNSSSLGKIQRVGTLGQKEWANKKNYALYLAKGELNGAISMNMEVQPLNTKGQIPTKGTKGGKQKDMKEAGTADGENVECFKYKDCEGQMNKTSIHNCCSKWHRKSYRGVDGKCRKC